MWELTFNAVQISDQLHVKQICLESCTCLHFSNPLLSVCMTVCVVNYTKLRYAKLRFLNVMWDGRSSQCLVWSP